MERLTESNERTSSTDAWLIDEFLLQADPAAASQSVWSVDALERRKLRPSIVDEIIEQGDWSIYDELDAINGL
jgi:hypothetical protein